MVSLSCCFGEEENGKNDENGKKPPGNGNNTTNGNGPVKIVEFVNLWHEPNPAPISGHIDFFAIIGQPLVNNQHKKYSKKY